MIVNGESLTVLEKFIRDYNLTNEEAAKVLGSNPKTFNEIKKNANIPDGFFIDKFCLLTGYEESEIFEYYTENENQSLTKSLFVDSKYENIKLFHKELLETQHNIENVTMDLVCKFIHKPIVSLIGDIFANKADCFLDYNLKIDILKHSRIPVYSFHSEDCPYCLQFSEPLVVTPFEGQTFEPSLAFNNSYIQKCQPKPFSINETYPNNSVILVVSDFQLLKNCILLVLPDLIYANDYGKLDSSSLSMLTRYIPYSDLIIFFDAITRLLTVSEVPLMQYLLSNKKHNKKLMFVATKTDLNKQLEGNTAYEDKQNEIQNCKQNNIYFSYYKAYSYKPSSSEEMKFIKDSLFYYHMKSSNDFIYKINEMCLSFTKWMNDCIKGILDNIKVLSSATNLSQIKSTNNIYVEFLHFIEEVVNKNIEKSVIEKILDEIKEESFNKKLSLDVFITFTQNFSSIILNEIKQCKTFMSEFDYNLSNEKLIEAILPEFNLFLGNLILPVIRQKNNFSKGSTETWAKVICKELKNINNSEQKDIFMSLIKQKLVFNLRGIV